MVLAPEGITIWIVLVAPGFIAVMVTLSLAALEQEFSQFTLLVWSLVSSLLIDVLFLAIYQEFWGDPIKLLNSPFEVLFTPSFRIDMVLTILLISAFMGVIYAIGIIYQMPRLVRGILWRNRQIKGHPGQPWQNFLSNSKQIRVKTTDDEIFVGFPVRWNNEYRRRELVIENPHRLNQDNIEYEQVHGDKLLFDGDNIHRITMQRRRENDGNSISYLDRSWFL